jgi:glycoprotein 6-alpha-L-fucosyltransferase
MRPSPEMIDYINEQKKRFKFRTPIVGVHVRRTDKIGTEAAFHPLSEYMQFVEDYYDRLDLINQRNKNVCLLNKIYV